MPDFSDWTFQRRLRLLSDSVQLVATHKVTEQVVLGTVSLGPHDVSFIDANLLVPGAEGCVEPYYTTVRHCVFTKIDTLGPDITESS